MSNLKRLKVINLEGSQIVELSPEITKLPNLERLNIYLCRSLKEMDIRFEDMLDKKIIYPANKFKVVQSPVPKIVRT